MSRVGRNLEKREGWLRILGSNGFLEERCNAGKLATSGAAWRMARRRAEGVAPAHRRRMDFQHLLDTSPHILRKKIVRAPKPLLTSIRPVI